MLSLKWGKSGNNVFVSLKKKRKILLQIKEEPVLVPNPAYEKSGNKTTFRLLARMLTGGTRQVAKKIVVEVHLKM